MSAEWLQLTFQSRPDCLGAGVALRERLSAWGWAEVEAKELGLVLVELAMNTVRHAGGGTALVELDQHQFKLTVEDDGPGFPPWLLERWTRGEGVEPAFVFDGPGPVKSGLGAGLDAARRMTHSLELGNRAPRGARAVATRVRAGRR